MLYWRFALVMICHIDNAIGYHHFAADLCVVAANIDALRRLKTLLTFWIGSWHSSLKRLNCFWIVDEKLCKVWFVIRKYSVCNCMLTWKKWTLKFKLLFLLIHIGCFNKICRICCVNSHVQRLKVWLKSVLHTELYSPIQRQYSLEEGKYTKKT